MNTRDMVMIWAGMVFDEKLLRQKYGRTGRFPKFSTEEAVLLTRIIFYRPYRRLIYELVGALYDQGTILCAKDMRRLRFLEAYLTSCNATQAAIIAGYSPKSAKQQANRLLKTIGNYRFLRPQDDK